VLPLSACYSEARDGLDPRPHERGRVPEVMAATGAMLIGRGTYEVTVVCPEFGPDEAKG